MKRDQRVVRCSVLDCFWEGRRDEACNSNVAHHLCDQGGSRYALSGRLVGIQEVPRRVGSTGRRQQLNFGTLRMKGRSLYTKDGHHFGKMRSVVIGEKQGQDVLDVKLVNSTFP